LTDLLIECGIVDRSMLEGRLKGAAARVAPSPLGLPPKKQGVLSRLFRRERHDTDQTIPTVNLPFKPVALYESERIAATEMGKCQRCWRIRPLSAGRLCSRCS
jgi:hypothetical protein